MLEGLPADDHNIMCQRYVAHGGLGNGFVEQYREHRPEGTVSPVAYATELDGPGRLGRLGDGGFLSSVATVRRGLRDPGPAGPRLPVPWVVAKIRRAVSRSAAELQTRTSWQSPSVNQL
jgi:hypothetical protein